MCCDLGALSFRFIPFEVLAGEFLGFVLHSVFGAIFGRELIIGSKLSFGSAFCDFYFPNF